jgi:hypothetical protein
MATVKLIILSNLLPMLLGFFPFLRETRLVNAVLSAVMLKLPA